MRSLGALAAAGVTKSHGAHVVLADVDENRLSQRELAGEVGGCDLAHAGARGLEKLRLRNGVGHGRPRI